MPSNPNLCYKVKPFESLQNAWHPKIPQQPAVYQQCPSQSHPMGILRKRHQIPFLYLVRAGTAASPSGHNQRIKTTIHIFTQMQHKHHPHLPEDYQSCVPVQIPSMKSLGARVQLKIHPMPRKDHQSPIFSALKKIWSPLPSFLVANWNCLRTSQESSSVSVLRAPTGSKCTERGYSQHPS